MSERITRRDLEKATEALVEAGATGEWVSMETMLAAALRYLGIEVEGEMSDNSKPTQNGSLSFELTDWLDKAERLGGAATEGPWAVKAGEVVARVDESPWPPQIAYATATGDVSFQPEDAEFIAWSRTSLPAAVAALRSVLDMHVKVVTDRHVAGPTAVCEPCSEDRMFAVWPCPTVAAITEALGEE